MTAVEWNGNVPKYRSNDAVVSLIKKNVAEFMNGHAGSEGHEIAKDEVYEGAPFRFQKEYRKLREALGSLCRNYVVSNTNIAADLFDSAMITFPKGDFKAIANERNEFEAIFRMALDNNTGFSDLFDFAEFFWFFFCYHLRLHRKCHENVPKETLELWKDKIPWEALKIRHTLQNYAEKFYKGGDADPLVRSLLDERKKRMDEIDAFMSKYSDDHVARTSPQGGKTDA
jgi:hypothetical protein